MKLCAILALATAACGGGGGDSFELAYVIDGFGSSTLVTASSTNLGGATSIAMGQLFDPSADGRLYGLRRTDTSIDLISSDDGAVKASLTTVTNENIVAIAEGGARVATLSGGGPMFSLHIITTASGAIVDAGLVYSNARVVFAGTTLYLLHEEALYRVADDGTRTPITVAGTLTNIMAEPTGKRVWGTVSVPPLFGVFNVDDSGTVTMMPAPLDMLVGTVSVGGGGHLAFERGSKLYITGANGASPRAVSESATFGGVHGIVLAPDAGSLVVPNESDAGGSLSVISADGEDLGGGIVAASAPHGIAARY